MKASNSKRNTLSYKRSMSLTSRSKPSLLLSPSLKSPMPNNFPLTPKSEVAPTSTPWTDSAKKEPRSKTNKASTPSDKICSISSVSSKKTPRETKTATSASASPVTDTVSPVVQRQLNYNVFEVSSSSKKKKTKQPKSERGSALTPLQTSPTCYVQNTQADTTSRSHSSSKKSSRQPHISRVGTPPEPTAHQQEKPQQQQQQQQGEDDDLHLSSSFYSMALSSPNSMSFSMTSEHPRSNTKAQPERKHYLWNGLREGKNRLVQRVLVAFHLAKPSDDFVFQQRKAEYQESVGRLQQLRQHLLDMNQRIYNAVESVTVICDDTNAFRHVPMSSWEFLSDLMHLMDQQSASMADFINENTVTAIDKLLAGCDEVDLLIERREKVRLELDYAKRKLILAQKRCDVQMVSHRKQQFLHAQQRFLQANQLVYEELENFKPQQTRCLMHLLDEVFLSLKHFMSCGTLDLDEDKPLLSPIENDTLVL